MQLRRLDDYQSWEISHQGSVILIDPWLTAEPISGSFAREHSPGFLTIDDVAPPPVTLEAVLLCTSVNDHTRPASLRAIAATAPATTVLGPRAAVRIARRAGLQHGQPVRPGDRHQWRTSAGSLLQVTVTRAGLPLGLIAVGYLIEAFEAPANGTAQPGTPCGRVWIEPHQPTARVAARLAPVDIAILPSESVTAVIMPVTAGPKATSRAVQAASARILVPTATNPRRDMTSWQRLAYRVAGSEQGLQSRLGPQTTLRSMTTGDVVALTSSTSGEDMA